MGLQLDVGVDQDPIKNPQQCQPCDHQQRFAALSPPAVSTRQPFFSSSLEATNFFIQRYTFTLRQQGNVTEKGYKPNAQCNEINQVQQNSKQTKTQLILGYRVKKKRKKIPAIFFS